MLLQYFKLGVRRNPTLPSSCTRNTTQYVFVIWKGYFFQKGYVGEEIIASLGFLSSLSFSFLVLPPFLDTGLPRGNGHEQDSLLPCKVPSLPNPTPPGSTSRTHFEHWCAFFYVPHEQISERLSLSLACTRWRKEHHEISLGIYARH